MKDLALYRLLKSLWFSKLKEVNEQKKAVFDLIFSPHVENSMLGWTLAESMQLEIKQDFKLLYSNFIRSNSYYYVNQHKSFKEALGDYLGQHFSRIYSLSFYNIHKLSPMIAYCSSLQHLIIRTNPHNEYGSWRWERFWTEEGNLHELPPEIGHLKQLEFFQLSRMPVEILPEELGELKALKRVVITNTDLKELPFSLCKLKQLEVLVLTNNQIRYLPAELIQLQSLKVFEIKGNPLDKDLIPAILFDEKQSPKAIWKALSREF